MNESIKSYKVFNPDWTCKGFQYEVGKGYAIKGEVEPCTNGFHACENVADCFNYYSFSTDNKVAEVLCEGTIIKNNYKICSSHIKIVREITWEEMLKICNTGHSNIGDRNIGNRNTGDWNTGNSNTGDHNTGHSNIGDRNIGNRNTGDWNTGNSNTGDHNTGNRNTGNCNTGYWNTGDWNTGNSNTGDHNTGNRNTGNCNTGYWNTGTNNAGNWNAGNRNTGFFCENTPKPLFFDVTTDLSWEEARGLVPYIEIPVACKWVYENDMTQEEKTEHPSHKTTGGYLRSQPINLNEAFLIAWAGLDKREKMRWLNLPNFDAKKFNKITGVELSEIIELQESK